MGKSSAIDAMEIVDISKLTKESPKLGDSFVNLLGYILDLSGRRDSNARHQPWQGCALPLSYTRELVFLTTFTIITLISVIVNTPLYEKFIRPPATNRQTAVQQFTSPNSQLPSPIRRYSQSPLTPTASANLSGD